MSFSISSLDERLSQRFGPVVGAVMIFLLEMVQIILISSAIIIPIRFFLIQPFYVKGASMEPNFHDDEYLIIDELSFRFRPPSRGEIVVFKYPRDPSEYFIKRVIGLPGETIEVSDGLVRVFNETHPNGEVLSEPYLYGIQTGGKERVTLASDEFYLMGDNRGASMDSRSFGPVKEHFLVGRVWLRGFPLSVAQMFDLPSYNL